MATNKTPTSSIASFSVEQMVKPPLVELYGLENSPHLNRRMGTIAGGILDNGRYPVVLHGAHGARQQELSSSPVAIKPENLKAFSGGRFDTVQCHGCLNWFSGLTVCGNCKVVTYCSEDCQQEDWHRHHKQHCALIKQGREAKHDETKLPTDRKERILVRISRAKDWTENGKHANAEAEYKALIQELPVGCSLRFRVMLVDSITEQNERPGKENDAIAILTEAVASPNLEPSEKKFLPDAYFRLGRLLWDIDDFDGAEQPYKTALDLEGGVVVPTTLIQRELQQVKRAKKDAAKKEKKKSSKGKKGRRK